MQHFHDLQLPKVLVLALLATLLGFAVLELDSGRRSASAVAASAPVHSERVVVSEAAPAGQLVAQPAAAEAAPPAPPAPPVVVERRGGIACAAPHRLVEVPSTVGIRNRPRGRTVSRLPPSSIYLGQSMTAWVQQVSVDGRWGKVSLPWSKPVNRAGWIPLDGLRSSSTSILVVSDLSERMLRVYRGCRELFRVPTAIGRPGSPSPQGRFWVTDRVAVPAAQQDSFGTFAFGLSTVQPNLPAGWTGGDQMAIHGTGAPGSIGAAASAGCLRVSEHALARLKPLLRPGTPVVITA